MKADLTTTTGALFLDGDQENSSSEDGIAGQRVGFTDGVTIAAKEYLTLKATTGVLLLNGAATFKAGSGVLIPDNLYAESAKTQKHTAADTAKAHKAANEARGAAGGGGGGKAAREAKKASGNMICLRCKMPQPNIQSMERHYDSKHAKDPATKKKINWNEEKLLYLKGAGGEC